MQVFYDPFNSSGRFCFYCILPKRPPALGWKCFECLPVLQHKLVLEGCGEYCGQTLGMNGNPGTETPWGLVTMSPSTGAELGPQSLHSYLDQGRQG